MRLMVTLLGALLLVLAPAVDARRAQATITRVETALATAYDVQLGLDWPADADNGELHLQARRVHAPDLAADWRALDWRCRLGRDGSGGWTCAGPLRSGRGQPLQLALDLGVASTDVRLGRGNAQARLIRSATTPDLTTLDLQALPVQWLQALTSIAWSDGQLSSGSVGGRLRVVSPAGKPLRVDGDVRVDGLALRNGDASIAAEAMHGRFNVGYSSDPADTRLRIDGQLDGGQLLAGSTFIALPQQPVGVLIEAQRQAGTGWTLPRLQWRDGHVLQADGSAVFAIDGALQDLRLQASSSDIAPLRDRYLSGQLALAGMSDIALRGAVRLQVHLDRGGLASADLVLDSVGLADPRQRLSISGLDGQLRHVANGQVDSDLRWDSGALGGIAFAAAQLPWRSRDGVLQLRAPVVVPVLGGVVKFDSATLRPPRGEQGLDIRFGLELGGLDVGTLAKALDLPPFQGTLGGFIPQAHYSGDRLQFDGGLSMSLFDGSVQFSSLVLERPFGTAPSLSAEIALNDVDLMQLTGVLDVGSITGRLDGTINGLRLVDWSPVAFDAWLSTDAEAARRHRIRQRISQRAVQDISSVGDASFVTSLQGQLIGIFSDFGYAWIGIGCRLERDVCRMSGLDAAGGAGTGSGSSGAGFTIVRGAGLPRLDVVGFNRDVDWPTLLERISAASSGEVAPRVE